MRLPALVAASLLAHAACAQNAATLYEQAQRLEHGEGVARDLHQAAALYCRAARLGAPDSQYALGWMYANGRGVAHDDGAAWRLFGLAAEQGHAASARMQALLPAAPGAALPACMAPDPALELDLALPIPDYAAASPQLLALVDRLAPEYEIEPALALAVIAVESGFNRSAVSPRDARGLMQLIPATASRFACSTPSTPSRTCAAAWPTCAGCWRATAATSRWPRPPTMPASRRSTSTAACRRTTRRAPMCGGSASCTANPAILTRQRRRSAVHTR